MTNRDIALRLAELADFMALDGADPHRVRHYRGTATALRRFDHSIAEMLSAGMDLQQVPGIGQSLAGIIGDLVEQARSRALDDYRSRIPASLVEVLRLDGVGPTRARTLWQERSIVTVDGLAAALADRSLLDLEGFGPGVVARIQRGVRAAVAHRNRVLSSDGDRAASVVAAHLASYEIEGRVAGDVARRAESVGSVDFVLAETADRIHEIMAAMSGFRLTVQAGANPVEGRAEPSGVRVRLVSAPGSTASAVAHHLTGPPEYLDLLADMAREAGLQLTPLGLADESGVIVSDDERSLYERLGVAWLAPELRSVDALQRARDQRPEDLIERGDLRGDLHVHTTWSDGAATLERMLEAASRRGYDYVAITDHSPGVGVVKGLDAEALAAQALAIEELRPRFPSLHVFRGIEVDILADGSLDLEDEVLAGLDIVVASVHSGFDMDEAAMTNRVIRAIEHPSVDIIGHPTGRKLGRREGYPISLDEVLQAAHDEGVAIEHNGNPPRLDLSAEGLWRCRELGVNVVINSDAHSVDQLSHVDHGVDQARRGWLEKGDVLNTGSLSAVETWLRRRRD